MTVGAAPGPSAAVLAAYGVAGPATLLTGGQGTSWRAGDLVFKRDRPEFAGWLASMLRGPFDGVRVAAPGQAADGRWGVDGWTAAPLLAGMNSVAGRYAEVFAAGNALHAGLPDVAEPDWARARADPWARADRVAWGEEPPPLPPVAELLAPVGPVGLATQPVHGDLAGNMLFVDGQPPGIIDFSPYWRPAAYATAIAVVDLVLWHGLPASIADLAGLGDNHDALLRRALAFRIAAHHSISDDADLAIYRHAAVALLG